MGHLIEGELLLVVGIPIYILILAICIFQKHKMNIKIKWTRELVKFIFVLYVLILLGVTLFPISIGNESSSNFLRLPINVMPFKDVIKEIGMLGTSYGGDIIFHIKLILKNIVGNSILLLPLGVMSPIIWEQFNNIKKIAIQGFIVTVCIELLQLIEILLGIGFGRTVDIDDVILNVLGAIIGYSLYRGILYISNKYHIKFITNIFARSIKN